MKPQSPTFVRRARHGAFVILFTAAAAASTAAHAWPAMDPVLDAATNQFYEAGPGGDSLKERNAATFDKLLADPQRARDPVALVFAGAATARMAQVSMWPWKKLSYAEDGMARIDKALALLQPKDEQAAPGTSSVAKTVRLIAASVFAEMPGFFNRGEQAKKLMDGLAVNADSDPTTTANFKATLYTLFGQQAVRDKNVALARKHFEKAIALNAKPESDEARRELKQLGS